MTCPHCLNEIEREIPNVYGTFCPHCDEHIKGERSPKIVADVDAKLKLLQATARQMLREKLEKDRRP